MKSYYLTLFEQIIGLLYLISFILGFCIKNYYLMNIGGFGMFIFMIIMTRSLMNKLISFLFFVGILSVIGYFFFTVKLGVFIASAFFSIGQAFALISYINDRKLIIGFAQEYNISDTISIGSVLSTLLLLIFPFIINNIL